LQLTQPDSESSQDPETWIVFSGLTGQATVTPNAEEVEQLFTALTTGWSDAD